MAPRSVKEECRKDHGFCPQLSEMCARIERLEQELAEATTLIGVLNKGRVGREYTVGPEGPTC